MQLEGKVAVVTGAAQGIGKAIVEKLAQSGAHIAAIDNDACKLNLMVEEMRRKNYIVRAYNIDVSDSSLVDKTIKDIEENMGNIQSLINVAGILHIGSIENLTDEKWDETFKINTMGVVYTSRSVISYMKDRKEGSIVTIGSNSMQVPRIGLAAYAASKAAIMSFTKTMGLEMAKYNIRCNIVSPGSTNTKMLGLLINDENKYSDIIAGSLKNYKIGIPLQKIAEPSDISNVVHFLVSDLSNHITMQNICVDGGATLGV
ncbi:2,3-dihydro-2,3-dihydroxybenzoate dehydrogenase [Bacillus subtilis]